MYICQVSTLLALHTMHVIQIASHKDASEQITQNICFSKAWLGQMKGSLFRPPTDALRESSHLKQWQPVNAICNKASHRQKQLLHHPLRKRRLYNYIHVPHRGLKTDQSVGMCHHKLGNPLSVWIWPPDLIWPSFSFATSWTWSRSPDLGLSLRLCGFQRPNEQQTQLQPAATSQLCYMTSNYVVWKRNKWLRLHSCFCSHANQQLCAWAKPLWHTNPWG